MAKSRKVIINGQTLYADVFIKMGKTKAIEELKVSYKMNDTDAAKAWDKFQTSPEVPVKDVKK